MLIRVIGIGFALVAGVLSLAVYRSQALVDQARLRTSNTERRIALLESEQKLIPWNDRVYQELGKAYFESGVNRLQDNEARDADLRKSYENFRRALDLNPLSSSLHFDFAQALQYVSLLDLGIRGDDLAEFMKAARLSGQNRQVFSEAGKVMFSRWRLLSPADREYAKSVAKAVLLDPSPETLEAYLGLWEIDIGDPSVLEAILPKRADVLRGVARFMGERGLPRDERLRYLVQAEALDLKAAREDLAAGQTALSGLKLDDARTRFRSALAGLGRIEFAQSLRGENTIDRLEVRDMTKSIRLGLAKCALEETRKLGDALEDLFAYLDLEEEPAAVGGLETFLKERNIIGGPASAGAQDFDRFLFQMRLDFKQNRFREIIQSGQALERGLLVIPEAMKPRYVRILGMIGDSYRKLDYVYESNGFFRKALDVGGPNIDLFLKMRKNFERLNDSARQGEVDQMIRTLVPGREEALAGTVISKEAPLVKKWILDGRKLELSVTFADPGPEPFPLVSVLFNGQAAWEDYLRVPALSMTLPSEIGENILKISVINRSVAPLKIKWSPKEGAPVSPGRGMSP
jgi:tetratricopeptide (TPR) repeat protein